MDDAAEKRNASVGPGVDPSEAKATAGLRPTDHWCELSPDALVCVDERWRVLFFNRAAAELFRAGGLPAIGEPPWESSSLLALLEELHLETLTPDQPIQRRTVRRIDAGKTGDAPQEAVASVSGEAGRRVFTICIRDVSRKDPAQQVLYQTQKGQLVGALAAGVAHDFNNILTAVICQIDLALLDPAVPALPRECLTKALASAKRGAELNTKLLQFSRQTETRPGPAGVTKLVEETIFLIRRGIDRRIQIQFDPPAGPLWPVWVDQAQCMQVLMNLCLNARDAMPKGGELSFLAANCTFTAEEARPPRQPGEFVRITVRDTGHGMTPEVLAHLFEPYFTTREFGKGAGLGLCIANHVVVEHGGWMEVESEPGRGSRFHVFFPRATGLSPTTAEPPLRGITAGPALEGNETVLVVDDEQPVRAVIQAMLTFRGYRVIEATDGADGIDRFRRDREKIHLVLLDIQMPRLNGWDTLEKLRELDPRIPVLMLSGGVSDPPADGSAVARATGIVVKPFSGDELLRAVRKALDAATKR